MFITAIFLVFIIFKAAASDPDNENPEVRLFYNNDGNKNYTVWKDKPLTIVIEDGYPRYVWCSSSFSHTNQHDFIQATAFSNDGVAKLSVKNVTAEMSTRWACTVLRNYVPPGRPYPYFGKDYTAKDLYFNLHVRGAKAVMLSANSRSLTYVTTNLSVNYDGEASYTYVEGEDLEISCKKAQDLDGFSTLRLEYYNAAGILIIETKSREKKPHQFRIILKSDNNNYYMECISATENPRREYRYRITFLKKKEDLQAGTDQRAMILSVNGQKLTRIFNKDSSYDDYIYRYIGKGILNVTCRKMDYTERGPLYFYFEGNEQRVQTFSNDSGAVIAVKISTSNLSNTTLICGINNTDLLKQKSRILFLLYELRHVDILGLARNNILYQYTNDEKRWTIEYQYSVNETLNLTCVSNARFQMVNYRQHSANCFEWKFEGISYESPAENSSINPSFKWSQQPFTMNLDATHNKKILRCVYFPNGKSKYYNENSSVELIFRLKPEWWVSEKNQSVSDEIGVENPESSTNNDILIYSLSSVLGVAVCTVMVVLIILYKRSRTQELTLPTPIPDPASRYYENMLSVFGPINEREAAAQENHYEEIQ